MSSLSPRPDAGVRSALPRGVKSPDASLTPLSQPQPLLPHSALPPGRSLGGPSTVSDALLDALSAPQLLPPDAEEAAALAAASRAAAPPARPASALLDGPQAASTGCAALDARLRGGLPLGAAMIVSLAGAAGCGKTQLSLQVALAAAAAAPDAHAVYVMTAGKFPGMRAKQIARERFGGGEELLARVVVENVTSPEALENWASGRLPFLLRKTGARVVVVDSMAAPFKHEVIDDRVRSAAIVRTAGALMDAMRTVGGVVLCINHVSSRMDNSGAVVPTLGHTWETCSGMRLFMDGGFAAAGRSQGRRLLTVTHAPHLECGRPIDFIIDETGVTFAAGEVSPGLCGGESQEESEVEYSH